MSREVENIKNKIDLVDLVQEYLKLTPAGANFKARCPFHQEKTPSFMVNRQKQIWRCFGCGEGGDIFNFLMKIENLDFPEALKILAQKAGVPLNYQSGQSREKDSRLYDLTSLASRYWHQVLLDSSQAAAARAYLKKRGVQAETIEDFRLGYAIDAWDNLFKFLIKKGFQEEEIFLAGLTVKKDRGVGFYDRFRGRLIFPISDNHGRVVGFGGRALTDDQGAKYLNTPQTPIYNKSAILYGFYQAKDEIKKNDLTILVEGYMDMIPSHQLGIKNVVAISGTALTFEQIKLLKRYSSNLSLALDMDAAGRKAAERSIDLALNEELNIKVITLSQGKDPGELIASQPAAWSEAIKDAQSIMDYFFAQAVENKDLNNPVVKKKIIVFLLNKIFKLGNSFDQDYWLKQLSQRLAVSEKILREELTRLREPQKDAVSSEISRPNFNPEALSFQKILALVLIFPNQMAELIKDLLPEMFQPPFDGLYKDLILFYTKNIDLFNKASVDNQAVDLFDVLNDYWVQKKDSSEIIDLLNAAYLLAQSDFQNLNEREVENERRLIFNFLKNNYLNRRINKLRAHLATAEKNGDQSRVDQIYSVLNDLIKQKQG